jgi:NAD(P)-dependent dehydrogenase (short-subunit alcohol dehydrogenase family)
MTGKVAVITGASQGIGVGLVAGYRARGWAVVASARTIPPSEDPDLLTVEGDIADPATAGRIVGAALDRFGRLDTLVNNAGVFISKPFTDYTPADYATLVGVNLTGFFWLTQRAVAEMATRYGGHVVTITATLAEVADSRTPAVLAALTKGGLAAATRSLAIEYASRGIRVNAVSPGVTIQTRRIRRNPTSTQATGCPRSGGPARSATSSTASCFSRHRPAYRRRPDRRPLTAPGGPAGGGLAASTWHEARVTGCTSKRPGQPGASSAASVLMV